MREGKGDKQCLRSSLNFTFILSFFHLAFTIPNKTKENTWTYEFQKQVVLMLKELKKEMGRTQMNSKS
jgi:hypothetical protein